jgi:hypothetical protein
MSAHVAAYHCWAWQCPKCEKFWALPKERFPSVLWRPSPEPSRPEFEATNTICCGQDHAITRDNIKWVACSVCSI